MSLLAQAEQPRAVPAPKIVIYGEEKIGKSTFASEAPAPIFMDIEGGLNYIPGIKSVSISDYTTLMKVLDELLTTEHKYRSVPIDSIGWLCDIIKEHVCKEKGVITIGDVPFGGGYQLIDKYMSDLLGKLDVLRVKKGMCIILIGHSVIRAVNNDPVDDAHDKHEIEGEKRLVKDIERWADCILFAKNKVMATESKKGSAVDKKTFDTGRVLLANKSAAYAGGSRMALPEEMPFEHGKAWTVFYNNYKEAVK